MMKPGMRFAFVRGSEQGANVYRVASFDDWGCSITRERKVKGLRLSKRLRVHKVQVEGRVSRSSVDKSDEAR
jgi:hypothetical protein